MSSLFDIGADFKSLAIEKINRELKEFKGDRYGEIVYTYVANALREFCGQNETFAEVLYKTKRSFSDCVREIMRGCGKGISDIEVYRRATKFYFPNSEIEFLMKITITGEEPDDKYLLKEAKVKSDNKTTAEKSSKPKSPAKTEKNNVIQLSLF